MGQARPLEEAWLQSVETRDGVRRLSEHADYGKAYGRAALFASSAAAIFSTIACISPHKANAPSMQVLMSMDEHAMVAPAGSANVDGDDRISHDALGLVTEHEYCATTGLGAPPMGMAATNPIVAHIDRQLNPLIEIRAL
jgi:hypothetical protein